MRVEQQGMLYLGDESDKNALEQGYKILKKLSDDYSDFFRFTLEQQHHRETARDVKRSEMQADADLTTKYFTKAEQFDALYSYLTHSLEANGAEMVLTEVCVREDVNLSKIDSGRLTPWIDNNVEAEIVFQGEYSHSYLHELENPIDELHTRVEWDGGHDAETVLINTPTTQYGVFTQDNNNGGTHIAERSRITHYKIIDILKVALTVRLVGGGAIEYSFHYLKKNGLLERLERRPEWHPMKIY